MHLKLWTEVSKTLLDVLADGSVSALTFGGNTVVLGGDFRQILSVITKGTREDVLHSAINASYLWEHCKVLRLTNNMRLQHGNNNPHTTSDEIDEFSNWILKVGDGELGSTMDGFDEIEILKDNLICDAPDPIVAIVDNIYPSITNNFRKDKYFEDRAILAPTHKEV